MIKVKVDADGISLSVRGTENQLFAETVMILRGINDALAENCGSDVSENFKMCMKKCLDDGVMFGSIDYIAEVLEKQEQEKCKTIDDLFKSDLSNAIKELLENTCDG